MSKAVIKGSAIASFFVEKIWNRTRLETLSTSKEISQRVNANLLI
jgi:hypothetical protein